MFYRVFWQGNYFSKIVGCITGERVVHRADYVDFALQCA